MKAKYESVGFNKDITGWAKKATISNCHIESVNHQLQIARWPCFCIKLWSEIK